MLFVEFCTLCRSLEATRSRLVKIAATADFLRALSGDEIKSAIAFLAGRPFPASNSQVLDVSWGILSAVLKEIESAPENPSLTLLNVAERLAAIAQASGAGSRTAKMNRLRQLFALATAEEREILKRILLREMRIGLHDGLIQDAVARAAGADPKLVRRAALFLSDLSEVSKVALTEGVEGLQRVGIRLFVPLLPMLAELAPDFHEVFEAHQGQTALEFKYDGARIQIHKEQDDVRIWSRRISEVTLSLPDIVEIGRREFCCQSCIVEGEVIAIGRNGRPLPFQELMRRFRRVREVASAVRDVPLGLYLFDCLWVDGRPLIDEPYEVRWDELNRVTGGKYIAQRVVPADVQTGDAFFAEALASGHEGVMAKALASPYMPGNRGKQWFKVKSAETVDCVIVAADRGSGRRRGWLSNYHLAVIDDAAGLAPVGKTFKGLTDQEFTAMTTRLEELRVADDGYTVRVEPKVVVEVAYNEIQRSDQYSSGFALRFARITRIREDKDPSQATTLSELRDLYEKQFFSKSRADLAGGLV